MELVQLSWVKAEGIKSPVVTLLPPYQRGTFSVILNGTKWNEESCMLVVVPLYERGCHEVTGDFYTSPFLKSPTTMWSLLKISRLSATLFKKR